MTENKGRRTRRGQVTSRSRLHRLLVRLKGDESGVSAIEYAVIISFIALGLIVAWTNLGRDLSDTFQQVAEALEGNGAAQAADVDSDDSGSDESDNDSDDDDDSDSDDDSDDDG